RMLDSMAMSRGTNQALALALILGCFLVCREMAQQKVPSSAQATRAEGTGSAQNSEPAHRLDGIDSVQTAPPVSDTKPLAPAESEADAKRQLEAKAKGIRLTVAAQQGEQAKREHDDLIKARVKFSELLQRSMSSRGLSATILTAGTDESILVFRGMRDCNRAALREYTGLELFATVQPTLKFQRLQCETSAGGVTATLTPKQ
ncbi:MAG: hypothetical protein ACREBE_15060, partial [bacterium]